MVKQCVCESSPTKWGTFRVINVTKINRTAGNPYFMLIPSLIIILLLRKNHLCAIRIMLFAD